MALSIAVTRIYEARGPEQFNAVRGVAVSNDVYVGEVDTGRHVYRWIPAH